jgi:hypothetical protein
METITKTAAELRRELLAERVQRGVDLLDREMPGWWSLDHEKPISLDLLDMGEGGRCVFGQLGNPEMECAYVTMARRVFGSGLEASSAATLHGVYAHHGGDYLILTDLWREVIEKRRANA